MSTPASLALRPRLAPPMLLLALAACAPAARQAPGAAASPAGGACVAPETPMTRTTLYFGLARRGGGEVSPAEWEAFLGEVLTPAFEGLTVLEARGQWMDAAHRVVHEPGRVVIVLHRGDAASRARIAEVIETYRARFDQESVLRESSIVCASF